MSRKCFCHCLSMLTLLVIFQLATAAADMPTSLERYFNGMRERGLWLIAEDYAFTQLKNNQLNDEKRLALTLELARTLVDHGSYDPDQRDELWTTAVRTLRSTNIPDKYKTILQAEHLFLIANQGEVLAWEAKLSSENSKLQQLATQKLQHAIDGLELWLQSENHSKELLERSHLAHGKTRLLVAELSISQTGQVWQCADDALKPLSKSSTSSAIANEAQLLRARISRHAKDFTRAANFLTSLEKRTTFPFTDLVLAEQLRLQLDQDHPEKAITLIRPRMQESQPLSNELRAVAVDALLDAWKIAHQKQDETLKKNLLENAQSLHAETTGKWQQYSAVRLRRLQEDATLGTELATTLRVAREAYHRNEISESVAEYAKAIGLAYRTGNSEKAHELAMTRASILLQNKQWSASAQAYLDITTQFPSHEKADDANLLRCYALGRQYVDLPNATHRELYELALQQHLKQFPHRETAPEVRWMLATHLEQRLQWTDAIEHYRLIPQSHTHFDEASLRITVLYENILNRLRELNGPLAEWEDRAIEETNRIAQAFPQSPSRWNITQCQTGLRSAQLLLQHRDRHYVAADQWLSRIDHTIQVEQSLARREEQVVDAAWKQLAQAVTQLRIVSLAGQQKLSEAAAMLQRLSDSDPTVMLGILQGLSELSSQFDTEQRRALGELQHNAIQSISQKLGSLTPEQRRMLSECRADAFAAMRDYLEAAEIYETLHKEHPTDRRFIQRLIKLHTSRGQQSDLEKSKTWWTKLERLEKPGTEPWIKARLEIAKLMIKLGDDTSAKKLLEVTKTLYPKLGNQTLAVEINAILAE